MFENLKKSTRKNFLKKISTAIPGISFGGILLADHLKSTGDIRQKKSDINVKPVKESRFSECPIDCDLLVYGASSAGVMAAYTGSMYGLHVILVEPGRQLGGLTSGGLGRTDTGGDDSYISGLSQEFYFRVGDFYGKSEPAYNFGPYVAKLVFERYVDEANIEVFYSRRVQDVEVQKSRIHSVVLEHSDEKNNSNIIIRARNYIDATYEGDLLARSGISYTIGRESNSVYNEKYNGVLTPGRIAGSYGNTEVTREWSVDVDPYVKPGNPASGLLPEITDAGHEEQGSGDHRVQAYCFRLCLTQEKDNQIPFRRPEKYDPKRYELMARLQKLEPWESLRNGFIISSMPRGKTDVNNYGLVGFSSNHVGGNYDYPDADYSRRKKIWNQHIEYQKGLWWFLGTDKRIPEHIRKEVKTWGYARDEFLSTGGWPHQLYIREARRMIGEFVMTEHECVGNRPVKDGIAMGGYALDSHVVQRIVVDGRVANEGNFFVSIPEPYAISYRSILPQRNEITNLTVPVCLSSSHAAFGSIRMEPVFMALGQAAGVASYLAVDRNSDLQDIKGTEIQNILRETPLPNRKAPREYATALQYKI